MRRVYGYVRLLLASWLVMGGLAVQSYPSAAATERDGRWWERQLQAVPAEQRAQWVSPHWCAVLDSRSGHVAAVVEDKRLVDPQAVSTMVQVMRSGLLSEVAVRAQGSDSPPNDLEGADAVADRPFDIGQRVEQPVVGGPSTEEFPEALDHVHRRGASLTLGEDRQEVAAETWVRMPAKSPGGIRRRTPSPCSCNFE